MNICLNIHCILSSSKQFIIIYVNRMYTLSLSIHADRVNLFVFYFILFYKKYHSISLFLPVKFFFCFSVTRYIEEHVQKTGVAIETQGFTFVTSGRKRESLTVSSRFVIYDKTALSCVLCLRFIVYRKTNASCVL